jgi:nitrite reductase/ring-hydroxylating ferredoxin subunit
MSKFIRVANQSELPIGSSKEVELDGRLVALFNVDGQIHAIDGVCPHQGGPLADGGLDGTIVTCPWHAWQFDVISGRNMYNPSLKQKTYEVKVEEGDIFLALP